MRLDFKKTTPKPSVTANKNQFFSSKDEEGFSSKPTRRRNSSVTDPTSSGPVIPCPALLPDPQVEDAKYREQQHQTAPLIYNPAAEGREAYEQRVNSLREEDLGPSPTMLGIAQKRAAKRAAADTSSPEPLMVDMKDSILARARHVTIGESARSQQYDEMPIEDFGMAMLMGMGFQPGGKKDVPTVNIKRRAALRAGLGAEKEFELPHERKAREEKERQAADASKSHSAQDQRQTDDTFSGQQSSSTSSARPKSHRTDDDLVMAGLLRGEVKKTVSTNNVAHLRDLL